MTVPPLRCGVCKVEGDLRWGTDGGNVRMPLCPDARACEARYNRSRARQQPSSAADDQPSSTRP